LGIKTALEKIIDEDGVRQLRAAAENISNRYRGQNDKNLQIQGAAEAHAYLASRMPATYAAARRALDLTRATLPDFHPQAILDIGAGPGTVALAALDVWNFQSMTLLEPNPHLCKAGKEILGHLLLSANWRDEDIVAAQFSKKYDLITAGYMLNEVPSAQITQVIENLWQACSGVLVLIEPGTPKGSGIIQQVRDQLKDFIIAPCPQSGQCPLRASADRWCHFSVRVERSRLHRQLKTGASLPYEDEKFSFIAFSRQAVQRPSIRLIGHSAGTKPLRLQVCNEQGEAATLTVGKKDTAFKALKKLEWGDGF
jgi:ribosomal protein RSM22 (predicted rRNA methylase)